MLPVTRHKWTHPILTQPDRPVLDLPTPEGWVDLGNWLHTDIVYPPADGHPSKYLQPVDHKSDALTTNYYTTKP